MKKKLIGVAVVAAMAVTAGWNYNQSQNEVGMSDLALANVEALARNESLPSGCTAVQERTCCVAGSVHHTWCKSTGNGGTTTSSCSHSY